MTRLRASRFVVSVGFWLCTISCVRSALDASPGLRWFLFANFGAQRICPEMLKQGVPLRFVDGAPSVGRFFPAECRADVQGADQSVRVAFGGSGYAYIAGAKRVGFSARAVADYRPDFRLTDESIYVWGKLARIVSGPEFQILSVENPVADAAMRSPLGPLANTLAGQLVSSELMRGFTVVQHEDRGNDFSLGILQPPQLPQHPFHVDGTESFVIGNETVDIYPQGREFLGPLVVPDGETDVEFTYKVAGERLDLAIFDRRTGDIFREAYQSGRGAQPPSAPPMRASVLVGSSSMRFALPPGAYDIVIDHSSSFGVVAPAFNPLGLVMEQPARLSYLARLVERE